MQTDAQKLVVVRDQFALKGLSDDALKQILPAYREALERLQFLLRTMPEGNIQRQLWLRTQLATIEAQFRPVADRIYQVLPEAQARAFEEGLTNARKYLEAGGIQPEPAAVTTTLSSTTIGGQQVSMTGNLPGFNVTNAMDKGFISPSITRQQIVAAARETGFSVLSPGGSKVGLADLLPKYTAALGKQVQDKLRAGFLLGLTNEEVERQIISVTGDLGPGRKGRAMTEAVVRTSMAEASQSAHDAFYEANEDLLPKTKSGFRWWWDASNDTRLCPVCAPLDGIKFKERGEPPHAWPAHFSCRCKILPWTATQELLEEEDGPASGSFLEATPVEYDRRGKRKPPPPGYTGDNAYKRPMKIDGQQQWVRRRDLGPGQTTAGDMLQNANEHSKRMVLGKHTEAFNKLTGKGGQYEKDPQGAVRKLLGNPLPPGSTPPRPTRGPGPKPVPPAPKAPATPKAKAAPAPAPKPPELRQLAVDSPAVSQWMKEYGGSGRLVDDALSRVEKEGGLIGEHAKQLRQFTEKNQVLSHYSMREQIGDYSATYGKQIDSIIASQKRTVETMLKTATPQNIQNEARALLDDLQAPGERRELALKTLFGKHDGCGGYTRSTTGAVNVYLKNEAKPLGQLGMADIKRRHEDNLLDAVAVMNGQQVPLPYLASSGVSKKVDWLTVHVHEMGHQVHFKGLGGAGYEGKHKAKGGLAAVSSYGLTNEYERFAEAYSQYVFNPEGLKRHAPGLYSWVEEAVTNALKL
jgi:hypothetical protein